MPQATLLSYFSKPRLTAPTTSTTISEATTASCESNGASLRVITSTEASTDNTAEAGANQARPLSPKNTSITEQEVVPAGPAMSENEDDKLPLAPPSVSSAGDVTAFREDPIMASVMPIQAEHLYLLKQLTATALPVRYSDKFFQETLTDPLVASLSRVVLHDAEPRGWIRCRMEKCSPDGQEPVLSQIYIQALALLAPYRGLGLATLMLEKLLASEIARDVHTVSVYAHVWEDNDDALEWYGKRGFKRVLLVQNYYKRLKPSGAWIVRKALHSP